MNIHSYDSMLKNLNIPGSGDQVIEDLRKALSTSQTATPGTVASGPLMLENLDSVMTEVLITENHFKLFNQIPKVPSAQPYYEWNRHTGFGANRAGGLGFAQGGAPQGGVSSFTRSGAYTKFLGVKRGITHQMLITGQNGGSFEDPSVRENRDGTLELLEKLERELVFGQAAVKIGGIEVNFDGLLAQLTTGLSSNVIDKAGAPLTFEDFDTAAEDLVTTGKQPSVNGYKVLMSPHVNTGLNKMYQDRNIVRHNKDGAVGSVYTPGIVVNKYDTQFGTVDMDYSILMQEVDGGSPLSVATTAAIAAPDAAALTVGAQSGSVLPLDTYTYAVAAFNDAGETLATTMTGTAAVTTAGHGVSFTISNVTGAVGFRVYRKGATSGASFKWIAKVAKDTTTTAFVDKGEWLTQDTNNKPSDGLAILFKGDAKDLCVAQLAPLVKMNLPQVDTTFPFLLLLYITAVIKAPERIKIFKNCGTYTAA